MFFKPYRRRLLSASALAVVFSGATSYAAALPSHGHFVSGQGSIAKGDQSVTVKQSSTTGIINWNNFSVGKNEGVSFKNGSGATLNRVMGGNLSTIAGALHATGSLYIMNSAGVIVSGTGHIVTGGSFVASSGSIGNAFDSQRFKAGAGNVVNKGTIIAGGSAALVGRDVAASGSIHASSVQLSAAHTLGISGSITAQNSSGAGGNVTARAHTIVIGTDGNIDASASGASQKGGTISVVARGTADVAGTLKAEGGTSGGYIDTSGEHVHVADSAKISTLAANGKAGTWLIDPQDFTIAASGGDITGATLSSNLAGGNVLIQSIAGSKSGHGDIFVDDAVSWSHANTLTLDAFRNIVFNRAVAISGAGGLTLIDADHTQVSGTPGTNDGNAADGDLIFNTGGSVAFTDVVGANTQGSLSINGNSYTLVNSIGQLATAIAGGANGNYALANNYNASGDNGGDPYSDAVVTTVFTGTFEGLGHAVSNLSISASGDAGLFAEIGTGGMARDITLTKVSVSDSGDGTNVGALAGRLENGTIENARSGGSVTSTGANEDVGGLVGDSEGTITDSSSAASVTGASNGRAGGLVGISGNGTFSNDFATGAVSGDPLWAGGFAGSFPINSSGAVVTVTDSYATGNVSGSATYMGGFAGTIGNNDGTVSVTNSFATGNVSGSASFMGGFAGIIGGNDGTMTVMNAYATGTVSGSSSSSGGFAGSIGGNGGAVAIMNAYATGAASSTNDAGGFAGAIGGNGGTISISDTYATGNASASVAGGYVGQTEANSNVSDSYSIGSASSNSSSVEIGGFAGSNGGTLTNDYSLGNATGTGSSYEVGGFVGATISGSVIQNSYSLGTATAGSFSRIGGFAGFVSGGTFTKDYWDTQTSALSAGGATGVTGLTTAGLMSKLPSGFSKADWATGPSLLPYLKWQFASAPDAVSGIELSGLGGTGVSGATIALMQNGANLESVSGSSTTTYANGFYYFLLAPGTISTANHAGLIAYDATDHAVAFADQADGSVKDLNLTEGFLNETTSETTLSAVTSDLQRAYKNNSQVANLIKNAANREIDTAGSFALNKTLTLTGGTLVISAATGTVTENHAFKVSNALLEGAADFDLASKANSIVTLAKKGNGRLSLKVAHALTVGSVGGVNGIAADGNVALTTNSGNIDIDALVDASGEDVTLNAAAGIVESGVGAIKAAKLSGSSGKTVTLSGDNVIIDLGVFTTGGTNFSLTDDHNLTVTGAVKAGNTLSLTTTGKDHDLKIANLLKGGTVDLVTTGEASELTGGFIEADKLNVTAATGIELTSKKNQIKKLGTDTTTKGPNKVTL